MNYIVLNEQVTNILKEKYEYACDNLGYINSFNRYIESLLSFEKKLHLYNRVKENIYYNLIGKECSLRLQRHYSNNDCFYADKISWYDDNFKYFEHLAQTIALPNEWQFIIYSDCVNLKYEDAQPISYFLDNLKGSYKEFFKFKDEWELWDIYNSKLREIAEKKSEESECIVEKTVLEHNLFFLELSEIKKEYEKEVTVSVKTNISDKFLSLGTIDYIDNQKNIIHVVCDNENYITKYRNKQFGKIEKIRIIDHGTMARLKRQKNALKSLFDNDTANKNLKEILMGEYDFKELKICDELLESANGLFGENLRQETAYKSALSANDIYMIQGPPGTGKTTIITEIVKYIVREGKTVLVASETNVAVDNILERIQLEDGVIAVRLGKDERIGDKCLKFTPKRISETIRNETIKHVDEKEHEIADFKKYQKDIETKWLEKIFEIEQEIKKILQQLPSNVSYEKLYNDITYYDLNTKLLSKVYKELLSAKIEYEKLSLIQKELKNNLIKIESQITVADSEAMMSGYGYADSMFKPKSDINTKLNQIKDELDTINSKIHKMDFNNKKTAYTRKVRRLEREKQTLLSYVSDAKEFNKTIFAFKKNIDTLKMLENRKKSFQNMMNIELIEADNTFLKDKKLLEKSTDIRKEWKEILSHQNISDEFEQLYLNKTNVVFSTCTGIASADNGVFAINEYDYVIVDEAAKCNMLDLLIPLVMGKKIILVGDHKQLYPMLETEGLTDEITDSQLQELKEHTLFKILYEERIPDAFKIMLNKQYRMPYDISQFASAYFYNNELESDKEYDNTKCMFWIDMQNSHEQQKSSSTSFYNEKEASAILDLVRKINRQAKSTAEIGIICIYKEQAKLINTLLSNEEFNNVSYECSTVDTFQGKEKDIIIFNTVRSNYCSDFVSDLNRTNVAITRAKKNLYVVGNSNILKSEKAGILKDLYQYINQKGIVYNTKFLNM